MDDLKAFRVPVLILSGGEPLLRPDIFDVASAPRRWASTSAVVQRHADRRHEHRPHRRHAISTTSASALDGIGATHDKFRRMPGAFDASLAGIRLCRDLGLKIGVRFTMTQDNAHDLPGLLELVEDEGIDRFYFSHLNYAGRGNKNRKDDAQHR
jgi:MoaA/NifB/PqqE/SkfB family radical SAM enzyme